jgi:hypothetical protein
VFFEKNDLHPLGVKLDKNFTWTRITDVVSTIEKDLLAHLRRMLCLQ